MIGLIGHDELVRAAAVNDSIIGEHGGAGKAPAQALQDVGVDIMGVMETAYEYGKKVCDNRAEGEPAVDEIMTAYTFGAISMARAIKLAAQSDAAA